MRLSLMKAKTSDTIEIGDKENGGTGVKTECKEREEYDGNNGADELLLLSKEAQQSTVAMVDW